MGLLPFTLIYALLTKSTPCSVCRRGSHRIGIFVAGRVSFLVVEGYITLPSAGSYGNRISSACFVDPIALGLASWLLVRFGLCYPGKWHNLDDEDLILLGLLHRLLLSCHLLRVELFLGYVTITLQSHLSPALEVGCLIHLHVGAFGFGLVFACKERTQRSLCHLKSHNVHQLHPPTSQKPRGKPTLHRMMRLCLPEIQSAYSP